ncbi:MAG: InlB B-repeat-containing protein [Treponema sp.]|nr:InlB B-repeat-containing protein [Treponema sp.]
MIRRLLALPILCFILASCNNVFYLLANGDSDGKYVMVVGGDGYHVRFDKNGGDKEPEPKEIIVKPPADTVGRLPEEPTRLLHAFTGWNTMHNGLGDEFTEDTVVNRSLTVWAQWRADSVTVTFSTNDGAGEPPSSETVGANSNIVLPGYNDFSKEGFDFAGWSIDPSGSEITYKAHDSYPVTRDITLYAKWNPPGVKTFTVSFDSRGGSLAASQIVNEGETAHRPDNPGRKGYAFDRWYGDSGLNTEYAFSAPVNSDMTLYADWDPIAYYVAYNANGGSGSMASSEHTYDVRKALTENAFTRTGFVFSGWNTRTDGKGSNYANKQNVENLSAADGNTFTLYAQWLDVPPDSHLVTFNADDGTPAPGPQVAADGGKAAAPPPMTKKGSDFGGWFTEETFVTQWNFSADTVTRDIVLYAKWEPYTYNVAYEKNGGSGITVPNPSIHVFDVYQTLTSNGFTREGYTFLRWRDDNNNTYTDGENVRNLSATNGATVTLHAQWDPITYTVKYAAKDANGGSTAESRHTFDTERALVRNGFTREGHAFTGWGLEEDGSEFEYYDEERVVNLASTAGAVVTLYARWILVYAVAFDGNGAGGTPPASETAPQGSSVILPGQGGLNKTGYSFNGWNTEADGSGTSYTAGSSYMPTGDITLYARWSPISYTVAYDSNGGTGSMSSRDHVYDEPKNLDANAFTRTGYTFNGWASQADGGGTPYTDEVSVINLRDTPGTFTMYAKWNPITYSVRYDANGGSGTMADSSHTYDVPKALSENIFSPPGYSIFARWTIDSGGSGTSYSDKAIVNNLAETNGAVFTLYAQWETPFTVTFVENGGTPVPDPQLVAYGNLANEPYMTKANFVLDGWYTDDLFNTRWYFYSDTVTDNITLYAKWIPTYTVTFEAYGGTPIPDPNPQLVAEGNLVIEPSYMTKADYTFDGWYKEESFSTKWNFNSDTVTSNIKLYAKWNIIQYTVTFNTNGGAGTAPPAQTADTGSSITLPGGAGLSRTRFTFDGWSTSPSDTGTNYSAGASYTVTGDITLYARWRATISFSANGGSGTPPPSQTGYADSYITLPGNTTGLSFAGHTFGGWNTQVDGGGANYVGGDSYPVTGDAILHANWTPIVITIWNVTFNSNGGSAVGSQSVSDGGTATRPSTDPTRTNCDFDNWYTDDSFSAVYNFSTSVTGNITLYARWKATITFDANYELGTPPPSQTGYTDSEITLPGKGDLTRGPDYEFDGWNTNAFGTGTTYPAGSSYYILRNTKLYARWVRIYTVTFDINEATGPTPAQRNVRAGSTIPDFPSGSDLSKDDLIFSGWNMEPDGTGIYINSSTPVSTTMTLYAIWAPAETDFFGLSSTADVTWFDLIEFSNELSLQEGLTPVYTINGKAVTADFSRSGYRLPTRAEWESAERATTNNVWYSPGSGTKTAGDRDFFGMGYRFIRRSK